MKIAVLFRGPVRLSTAICLRNIGYIRSAFKDHECDMFLFAWEGLEARQLLAACPDLRGYLTQEPNDKYIEENILTSRCEISYGPANAYKHLTTVLSGVDIINSVGDYDFIFMVRLDLEFRTDDISPWLDKDCYTAQGGMWVERNKIQSSDVVGCGTPDVMRRAHDFGSVETLNKLYGESICIEDAIEKIMRMNGVKLKMMRALNIEGHPPCPNKHDAEIRILRRHHI